MKRNLAALIVLMSIFCAGCTLPNSSTVQLVPVTGEVLMDGKPLADAKVLFIPQNKDLGVRFAMSHAVTDENGKFMLQLPDERPGAYVGWHHVLISKVANKPEVGLPGTQVLAVGDSEFDLINRDLFGTSQDLVPRYYNAETELVFEVMPGRKHQTAKFELSSVDPLLK